MQWPGVRAQRGPSVDPVSGKAAAKTPPERLPRRQEPSSGPPVARLRPPPPRKKCTQDRAGITPAGSCVARARWGKGHRVSPGIGRPPRNGPSKSIKRRDSPSQPCSPANAFMALYQTATEMSRQKRPAAPRKTLPEGPTPARQMQAEPQPPSILFCGPRDCQFNIRHKMLHYLTPCEVMALRLAAMETTEK
jgi:hypothetical protein